MTTYTLNLKIEGDGGYQNLSVRHHVNTVWSTASLTDIDDYYLTKMIVDLKEELRKRREE